MNKSSESSKEIKTKDIYAEFIELLRKQQVSDEKIQRILNILYR